MPEVFRWGIIGPGRIAERFADDLKVVPGSALYALASRSGSDKLAKKFGVELVYPSYEELAADPQVDAIYIATPHPFHFDNSRLVLEAGRPVLIEKPITVNAAEAKGLFDLAAEKEVFLMEAMWSRFLPVSTQIRTWLDEGVIGKVQVIQAQFGFRHTKSEDDRWLNPYLAGGCLLDNGVYPLAAARWITGEDPAEIQAQAILGSTGVDVAVSANLKYPSGTLAQIASTFLADTRNELVILGAEGKISIDNQFYMASKVTIEVYGEQPEVFDLPLRGSGFEYQIEEVIRCVREGALQSSLHTHADALSTVRTMDAIRAQIGVRYPFE